MSPRIVSALALVAGILTAALAAADPEPTTATATPTTTATAKPPSPPTAPPTAKPTAPAPATATAPTTAPATATAPTTAPATPTTNAIATPTSAAPPAWLAPPVAAPTAPVGRPEAPPSPWRSILLLLAVGGIGGYAFYLRRRKQTRLVAPVASRLQVLETVRVSPRAQVVLTQVNGRLLLLGVTDQSVRRIAWAGRAEEAAKAPVSRRDFPHEPDEAPAARAKPTTPPRPFQAMIDALKGVRTSPPPPSDAALQIAEETRDTYERRAPANTNRLSSAPSRRPSSAPPAASTALRSLDALVAASPTISQLEGQVSGLRRRAIKRQS